MKPCFNLCCYTHSESILIRTFKLSRCSRIFFQTRKTKKISLSFQNVAISFWPVHQPVYVLERSLLFVKSISLPLASVSVLTLFLCLSTTQTFCSCNSHHWTEASLIWTSQQEWQSFEDVKLSLLFYTVPFRVSLIMLLPSLFPYFILPFTVAIKNQLRWVTIKWQECRREGRESWKIEEFLQDKEEYMRVNVKKGPRKTIVSWEVELKCTPPP